MGQTEGAEFKYGGRRTDRDDRPHQTDPRPTICQAKQNQDQPALGHIERTQEKTQALPAKPNFDPAPNRADA